MIDGCHVVQILEAANARSCDILLLHALGVQYLDNYLESDFSWASGVRFDCPPHLKINLVVSSNYVGSFMLSSKNAQFHLIVRLSRCIIVTLFVAAAASVYFILVVVFVSLVQCRCCKRVSHNDQCPLIYNEWYIEWV